MLGVIILEDLLPRLYKKWTQWSFPPVLYKNPSLFSRQLPIVSLFLSKKYETKKVEKAQCVREKFLEEEEQQEKVHKMQFW